MNNKRFLVPVEGKGNAKLTEALKAQGALVTEILTEDIKYLDKAFEEAEPDAADWIIFTNEYAVKGFFEAVLGSGYDFRTVGRSGLAVIGKRTENILLEYGYRADLVEEPSESGALFNELLEYVNKTTVITYPKSTGIDGDISLLRRKAIVNEYPVYSNVPVEFDIMKIDFDSYEGIFFENEMLVNSFLKKADDSVMDRIREMKVYALDEDTKNCLSKYEINHAIMAKAEVEKWRDMPTL